MTYFEVVNPHANPIREDQYIYIQFVTKDLHPSVQSLIRMTTTAGRWSSDNQSPMNSEVAAGCSTRRL